jgi:GTP-binding protein YchF
MKLGIIGLPQSGKSTVFAALSGARGSFEGSTRHAEGRIATVTVYDERITMLSEAYSPKRTTFPKIEYVCPARTPRSSSKAEGDMWNQVRICDGLLAVVRNFTGSDGKGPNSEDEFWQLEDEMVLFDLDVAERRLERISSDKKKGKKSAGSEEHLLQSCKDILDRGEPLRSMPHLAADPILKGFTFLSAKPVLVIINNDDEDESLPQWKRKPVNGHLIIVRGRLERDIATMSAEEATEFLEAYHIREFVLDRVIRASYDLLDRISFFTVGSEEVRGWPIPAGMEAVQAAGVVHSDMQKGFIRAEVLAFDDFKAHGSFQEAKKGGRVRLEGKDYVVTDGDIINFRFNV